MRVNILKTLRNSIFKFDILPIIRARKSRNSGTIPAFTSTYAEQNIFLKNRIFRCFEYIYEDAMMIRKIHEKLIFLSQLLKDPIPKDQVYLYKR